MTDKSYEEGLREGRINAVEEIVSGHKDRLDHHSGRIRRLERVAWITLGVVLTIQILPQIQNLLQR